MKGVRQKRDLGIYGWTAKWYDRNYRKTRLDEMRLVADLVAAHTDQGATVLEVAPGPGYLSIELARRGFHVTGVEISPDFVKIEQHNAREANVLVDFQQGNAAALPQPDSTVDFVVCSAAFKNFKEPLTALREMYRVLKPKGTALILDMNHAATNEDIENELNRSGAKGFDRLFVKFTFKTFLRNGAYTQEEFEELIAKTSFPHHDVIKYGIGFQVWLHKEGVSRENHG